MVTFTISKRFRWKHKLSENAARVCRMFGLTADRLDEQSIEHRCTLKIKEGDIVYITGPSGSGKTVILEELERKIGPGKRVNLSQIELSKDKAVIDCIDGDIISRLQTLSLAGLNDVFCVLNRPARLSEGQKWRFRLAKALGKKAEYVFADEFCSGLDRITACVIAHNIRKFADRTGTKFILASSHEDILLDLSADVLVVKDFSGPANIIYKDTQRKYA
jgi:ABC-type ATPase with predicted acetyltransferase domain